MALGRTVGELEAGLTEAEFREWHAFDAILPFGDEADFYRTGVLASVLANIHRDPKKSEAFTPEDFMPKPPAEKPSGTKALRANLRAVFGDRVKGKKDAGRG